MSWKPILSTLAASVLLLLVLLACKRNTEPSPAEKAADEERMTKEVARGNQALQTLAALEAKVKTAGTPPAMKSSVLESKSSGYANFDVLLADELSDPNEFPKIRIGHQEFAKCAKMVKARTVSISDCSTPYAVVLKPATYQRAEVAGDSFTPGKVDATAYVFDMKTSELIGGGHIVASTPKSITTKSSTAENDLNDKLATAAFESIVQELNVKTN